jgi:hypothetical protein
MPYTGIVLALLSVHLAAFLILLAHWLVSAGLFPQTAQKLAGIYDQRPVRALLIGVFTYLPIQVIAINAGKIPFGPIKFVAVVAGFGSLLIGFIGTCGLALRIGRNLSGGADPWQQVLRGGVMLALVFITPLLGWFFALPVGLASGFGAMLIARPWKREIVPPLPGPVAEEAPIIAPAASLS